MGAPLSLVALLFLCLGHRDCRSRQSSAVPARSSLAKSNVPFQPPVLDIRTVTLFSFNSGIRVAVATLEAVLVDVLALALLMVLDDDVLLAALILGVVEWVGLLRPPSRRLEY